VKEAVDAASRNVICEASGATAPRRLPSLGVVESLVISADGFSMKTKLRCEPAVCAALSLQSHSSIGRNTGIVLSKPPRKVERDER